MDRQLRAEIVAEVRKAMESLNERWVTADTLCEHVQVLTPRWLRDNGSAFDRTRAEWTDKDGNRHCSSWMYPLHKILNMVADGSITDLIVKQKEGWPNR